MTYELTTRALFERVLETLTKADGSSEGVLTALSQTDPDTRALALIRALLTADAALEKTFTDVDHIRRDRDLARRTALTLTEQADRIEADTPARAAITLADLDLPPPLS